MWSPLSSESPSPSHRQLGRKIPESCSGPPLRRCYGRDPTFRPPRPAAVAEVLRWRALRRQLGGVSPAARRSGAGRGGTGPLLPLPPLSCGYCTLPFELTPIRVCTCTSDCHLSNLYAKYICVISKRDAFGCCSFSRALSLDLLSH